MKLKLPKIRAAAKADRTEWRRHALLRATERGITIEQALQVVLEGEIIEEYPQAKPYPACLMMAMIEPGKPLYVSVAYDPENDLLYIITVHWLDPRNGRGHFLPPLRAGDRCRIGRGVRAGAAL